MTNENDRPCWSSLMELSVPPCKKKYYSAELCRFASLPTDLEWYKASTSWSATFVSLWSTEPFPNHWLSYSNTIILALGIVRESMFKSRSQSTLFLLFQVHSGFAPRPGTATILLYDLVLLIFDYDLEPKTYSTAVSSDCFRGASASEWMTVSPWFICWTDKLELMSPVQFAKISTYDRVKFWMLGTSSGRHFAGSIPPRTTTFASRRDTRLRCETSDERLLKLL